jgi:hypothetical protein
MSLARTPLTLFIAKGVFWKLSCLSVLLAKPKFPFGETVKSTSVHYSAKMVVKVDDADDKDTKEGEFPEVPDEAIVKPEDERPVKMTKNPEEELPGEENKHDDEGIDDSTDMDGDGSPDL